MSAAKKKKPKDPNAPKRPQTAFFLYMNGRRAILRDKNPNKSNTEITKLIAQEWKSLKDKSKYQDQATKLKKEYAITLEEYKKTDKYKQYQAVLAAWKSDGKDRIESEAGRKERLTYDAEYCNDSCVRNENLTNDKINKMDKDQLQKNLKWRRLKCNGSKMTLKKRLKQHLKEHIPDIEVIMNEKEEESKYKDKYKDRHCVKNELLTNKGIDNMDVYALKRNLRWRGLKVNGRKVALKNRLKEYLKQEIPDIEVVIEDESVGRRPNRRRCEWCCTLQYTLEEVLGHVMVCEKCRENEYQLKQFDCWKCPICDKIVNEGRSCWGCDQYICHGCYERAACCPS